MMMILLGCFIISYILGSIPFGYLLMRLSGKGDVRQAGSGSTGATNVMRTGNKFLGALTLLLDGAKGALAIYLITRYYGIAYAPLAGLIVVTAHIFPVWLNFKGGKGVATALGVFFATNWMLALSVCVLWLAIFAFSRISSVSSLLSIGYSAIIAYVVDNYSTAILCLCIAVLIMFSHRENIIRLLGGKEPSFRKQTA